MLDRWRIFLQANTAKQSFAVLASGSLLGVGFLIPVLWPLAIVGVALFIKLILRARNSGQAIAAGFFGGLILYLLANGAIFWETFPLDWAGITSLPAQLLFISLGWVSTSTALASGYAALGYFIYKFQSGSWRDVLLFPTLWVLAEYLGALFFSVASYGQGSLLGAHFTWGWLGYLLADDFVLLQAAWLGGVYILSFIVVILGTLLYKAQTDSNPQWYRRYQTILIVIGLLWLNAHLFNWLYQTKPTTLTSTSETHINVAAISRHVPPSLDKGVDYWEQRSVELLELAMSLRNVDMIVFPEASDFLEHLSTEQAQSLVGKNNQSLLMIDSKDVRGQDDVLRSTVIMQNGLEITTVEKQVLVPLGEYIPFIFKPVFMLIIGDELLSKVQTQRGYRSGSNDKFGVVKGVSVAVRLCDEVMSPSLYRRQVKNGANVLVNLSSLSWFHGRPITYMQMKRIAKVRAVENGRWYVQSGNMAPAFILDHRGRVVGESEEGSISAIEVQVPNRTKPTLYTFMGW